MRGDKLGVWGDKLGAWRDKMRAWYNRLRVRRERLQARGNKSGVQRDRLSRWIPQSIALDSSACHAALTACRPELSVCHAALTFCHVGLAVCYTKLPTCHPALVAGSILIFYQMSTENLSKQLLYRSIHRGCKETDFLIGEFAESELAKIKDLELFGKFLEEDDLKIYDWILAKENTPEQYKGLVQQIREFHKI